MHASRDWRPYVAAGVALGVALAINLWAENGLWFRYTVIGIAGFLTVVGIVRAFEPDIPPLAVWMVGSAMALHFVGGSLAGVHSIGGPNGLYYVFPWWDNVVHTLGSAAIGIASFVLLSRPLAGHRLLIGFLALAVACFVGALVELYEFSQFVLFDTIDQGFYTNTMLDLYYNLLGALVGVVAYAWGDFRASLGQPGDSRSVVAPRAATSIREETQNRAPKNT